MKYTLLVLLSYFIFSCSTSANSNDETTGVGMYKRSAPKTVAPIYVGGKSYHAGMNEITAIDTLSEEVLWKKEIYLIEFNENLERDVQEVYIDSMYIKDNLLIIRNEEQAVFALDLKSVSVLKVSGD